MTLPPLQSDETPKPPLAQHEYGCSTDSSAHVQPLQ